MKASYAFVISVLLSLQLQAQNISGVVNAYAEVTAISGRNFTIGTPGGKAGAALSDFNAGAVVLIYQAKGASAASTNISSFGDITAYNSAGRYEMTFVRSRSGNTVKLTNVRNRYNVSGKVQLISVPNLNNATINGVLTATAWDNTLGYGGVVALKAQVLTIASDIDVSGLGFEGGAVSDDVADACNATNNATYGSTNGKFAFKGEGIVDFPALNRARAELGNGGGGANPHNGGGGGGSNWASGGTGGIGWKDDGCTEAISAGGYGGNALDIDNGRRLFFGGGGGGGQQNNSDASAGGNGGGLVVILSDTIRLNCPGTFEISADGVSADTSGQDGAGGGGAGGSIVINTRSYEAGSCILDVHANGGNGGDVQYADFHGGGGGGGTGPVASNIANSSGVLFSSGPGLNGVDCDTCTITGSTSDAGQEPANDSILGVIIPGDANQFSCAPGGLGDGLLLWLRADEGVTTASGAVTEWQDQSGSQHHFSQGSVGARPSLVNSGARMINFNPSIDFDGSNDLLEDDDGEDYINGLLGITITSVLQADGVPAERAWWDAEDSDNNDDVLSLRYDASGVNGGCSACLKTGLETTSGSAVAESQSNLQTTNASVVTFDWQQSSSIRWFVEGASTANTNNNAGGNGSITNATKVIVGDGTKTNWDGLIAELVIFDERLDDASRLQLESYLALKYGVNKTGNYILPDSTVIWDASQNASYNNAVFGLGAYNGACLDMTKSQSEVDLELIVQNPSGLSSGEAILFGHNNLNYLDGDPSDVPLTLGVQKRLRRVWRVQETDGDVGTLELLFDTTGFGSLVIGDLRFLIDRDGDGFADGDVTPISGFSFEGGFVKITGINLQDGDFFTLGTSDRTQTPLPLDLIYFNAELMENDEVLLSWQTAEPKRWSNYIVQKSTNAKVFKDFANVKSEAEKIEFKTIDFKPSDGINYYRLKSVDESGVVNYSFIESIAIEKELAKSVTTFPNPIRKGSELHIEGLDSRTRAIELIDIQGRVIKIADWYESDEETLLQIPNTVSSGLYLVKITSIHDIKQFKLVVE